MNPINILRPRVTLTAGAVLVLAVPLSVLAAAGVTIAVVAVLHDKPLREMLAAGAKIAADAERRVAALDELLSGIDDIGGMVASAKRVLHRAESASPTATPTGDASPVSAHSPQNLNGAPHPEIHTT